MKTFAEYLLAERDEGHDARTAKIKKIASSIVGEHGTHLGAGVKHHSNGDGSYTWRKHGGHPDAKKATVIKKAEAAGFVETDSDQHGNPDGSVMGNTRHLHHPDGRHITVRSTYGGTAADNNHSIVMHVPASHLDNSN